MNKQQATTRRQEIAREINALQAQIDALLVEDSRLKRIESGEDAYDAYFRTEQEKERQKWADIANGNDAYSKWSREQAEINAAKDAELSAQRREQRERQEQARQETLRLLGGREEIIPF